MGPVVDQVLGGRRAVLGEALGQVFHSRLKGGGGGRRGGGGRAERKGGSRAFVPRMEGVVGPGRRVERGGGWSEGPAVSIPRRLRPPPPWREEWEGERGVFKDQRADPESGAGVEPTSDDGSKGGGRATETSTVGEGQRPPRLLRLHLWPWHREGRRAPGVSDGRGRPQTWRRSSVARTARACEGLGVPSRRGARTRPPAPPTRPLPFSHNTLTAASSPEPCSSKVYCLN